MQIRFKKYFVDNKIGIVKLIGTFLFLILTLPILIGSTYNSPAERAEIVGGVLHFSSINPNLCNSQGGDSDGDGVCDDPDCQPDDPAFPATPGTTCNDGSINTINDVVQSDGCSCAGTNLEGIQNFTLFTSTGALSNAGMSTVNGNVGTNVGALTGFGWPSTLNGTAQIANAATAQGVIDVQNLYDQLLITPQTVFGHAPAFGSGETVLPGVYAIAAAGSLSGTITLNGLGDPDAIFIFKFGGAFTTGAASNVILSNGAQSCNVFWISAGAISMGASTQMKGTLISSPGAITMSAGGILEGRLLSTAGAIAIANVLVIAPCAATPCDDGDPSTENDVLDENGNCAGTACPAEGTCCDDNNPLTENDTADGNCNCVGTLGGIQNFTLFTSTGALSNAGTSTVNGNVGTNVGALTGFGWPSTLNGTAHTADAATAQGVIDVQNLYDQLLITPQTVFGHAPAFGSGETVLPGVYEIAGAGSLAGTITLNGLGNSNAIFIFKFGGAFTTGAVSNVILSNGAQSCNVFWISAGAISMGASTQMKGTLISSPGAISMATGGILEGRLLSTAGAIAISNILVIAPCAPTPSTPTPCDDGNPPIANLDTINVLQGTSGFGNVLLNDSDPDGDVLILNTTPVVAPTYGTVTINADGTFIYVPYPFFVGTDQFTYEICDGNKADVIDSYDNQTNVTITPFGTPTVSSTITVSSGGTITDVNIPNFYLEHSWNQDLVITLTSPSGTVVTLVDQVCEDENFDIGFDDESGVTYGSMPCPPDEGGMNQPFESLSVFDGENSVGDWVLTIYDVAFSYGGFLDFWYLDITSLGAASGTNCVTATVTALVYSSSTEICNNNIDDDGDGLVDVFDPDCPCDDGNFFGLCDPQCQYTPPGIPSFDIEVEWASEDSVNTFTPVIGADLDGDISSVEILGFKNSRTTYTEDALFIIDGANGLTKYKFNSKPLHVFNKGLAFADVDKDGNGEIYYMIGNGDVDDYRKIACYEYNPAGVNLGGTGTGSFDLQWVSDQRVTCGLDYPFYTVTDNYAVNLADFNSDGFPEVYVGNEIFDAITGTRLAAGGANNIGNNIYNFYLHEHFHANTVAVDALPDGDCTNCNGLELVAGNQVYSVDLMTGVMTVERELTTAPGYQDGPVSIADYDLDGDVDGIITTTDADGSYLYIWDLQTETMIGNAHTIADADISTIWYRSASNATIADFDGDNKPEIGVCANFVFQVIEDYEFDISGTGGVAWSLTTTDRSGMTGATSFDFNADGLTEVVYRDEDSLRIISGASGVNLSTFPCGSRTGGEYPIVLDIDNDNETELVCTCADETYARNGRMRAFKSVDYPWVPTRNVWNQYAYFITNINDDLSIPPVQQPHHMVGSPAIGTTGRMNSFLKQVGPYNNEGEPVFPAADILVNILVGGPTECILGDSIDINLRFYNLGDLSYPAGIPFTVYEGNPENTGTLVGRYEIPTSIIPGDSVDVSITLAVAGLTSPFNLFVIGNDDGSLALPLDLQNDFPATFIGECDFSNNMDSILIDDCETEAPILVGVPDDVTIECDETLSVPTVTATDNCSTGMTVVYSFDENLGSCTGTINRTWTVADECGNVATETQTITIQDSEAPSLWGVPSNTTVDCNSQVPAIPNVTATDNCSGIMSITYDSLLTSENCPYSITRTWTATDSCNNSVTESYTIYVLDDVDPVFDGVPANITVECTEIPEVPHVTVSDNCDNDIELTYEDVYLPNGNYEDNDESTVPASGKVWNINVNGYGTLDASDFLSFDLSFESNKGKGRAEFVLINPSGQGIFLVGEYCNTGDCEGTGGTLIWSPTFYRCDTGNPQWNNDDPIPPGVGDFTPHGATPIDPVPGVAEYVTCFEDFTGPMDGQWQLYARKNQTANGLLKFQGFSFNLGNHPCLDEGTIFRTWTATDDCGNTATASQTITLEDTTPPLVDTYIADTTVACYSDIPSVPNLTITDCDDNATITYQGETGSGDCEYEIIRTWLAADACGNDTLLTQTITVKDTIAPVLDAAPADITISCEDDIPDPAELEATDNCWDDVEIDFSEYLNMDVCPFILRRVWIAIDECDNADSVVQIITIVDDT
ncbi:MAG: subtilisin-like proprotein convertase family protein, partial [Granulosicoccus sp.]